MKKNNIVRLNALSKKSRYLKLGLCLTIGLQAGHVYANPLNSNIDIPLKTITLNSKKAFPSAYGAGAHVSGGRDGIICYVNRLDDPNAVQPDDNFKSGTGVVSKIETGKHLGNYIGSLRGCLTLEMPRLVYFLVGGRFEIERIISLSGEKHNDLTIAGETALPLGGLHITGDYDGDTVNPTVNRALGNRSLVKDIYIFEVDNILIRYMDRKGTWQYWRDWGDGTVPSDDVFPNGRPPSGRFSPLNINSSSNIIVDHYTGGWGSYPLLIGGVNPHTDIGGNISVQNSLMHESIGTDVSRTLDGYDYPTVRGGHNVGNLFGYQHPKDNSEENWRKFKSISVHNNAYIGLTHRFPNMNGYVNSHFYVSNNYIDHWGSRGSYIGGSPQIDLRNNYYRKAVGAVNTAYNDTRNRTLLTLHPDSKEPLRNGVRVKLVENDVQSPSILAQGNIIETSTGAIFDNDDEGLNNWQNMAGFWSNSKWNLELSDEANIQQYERAQTLPELNFPFLIKSANDVRSDLLTHGSGSNARIYPDGSTFINSAIDKMYFDWARNNSSPKKNAVEHGDGGLGDSARFVHPYYPSRSISLDSLSQDGVPLSWTMPSNIVNNAGYSKLDLYLAELAGDFFLHDNQSKQIHDNNAASASTDNETLSIGNWQRNSSTVTAIDDDNYTYSGDYSIKTSSNAGGYSSLSYTFPAEIGEQYHVSFRAARSKGSTQGAYNWKGVEEFEQQDFDESTPYLTGQKDNDAWQEFSQIVTAKEDEVRINIYATAPFKGPVEAKDDIFIDHVSIARLGTQRQQLHGNNVATAATDDETLSIGQWKRNSSTVSVVDDSNYVYTGNASLHVSSNTGGYSSASYSFPATIGKQYDISFYAARSQGLTQGAYNWKGVKSFVQQSFDPETPYISGSNNNKGVWQEFTQTVEASADTITINIYATAPFKGIVEAKDDIYIDNVSITER